ncbi:MAG: class 1 isoprenoid biosynthesis enzyme [Candidatus Helarchaeota archaeon]
MEKFKKFGLDIQSVLDLRKKFVKVCSDMLNIGTNELVWSSVVAPSLLISLILSREFEKSEKRIIYANCLVDLCHLYFALIDRILDNQITSKNEIEKYKKTSEIFRCCYRQILDNASNQGLVNKELVKFFKNFFDNLINYSKRKVYKKDDEIKAKNMYDGIFLRKKTEKSIVKEIIEVHKTKFGNFFRGMGYFLFKFFNLNYENNRAYFDLFYNIGMLAQLLDDLRDFFWQDIDIKQPNIVLALLFQKTWKIEGKKLIKQINDRKMVKNDSINEFKLWLDKMRQGEISVYDFYKINFPKTYHYINKIVEQYQNKIHSCLKELKIQNITSTEIVEVYGVIIPLVKKLSP